MEEQIPSSPPRFTTPLPRAVTEVVTVALAAPAAANRAGHLDAGGAAAPAVSLRARGGGGGGGAR